MNRGAILVIARLTLREAFRRRLLWALVGLTFLLVAVTGWLLGKAAELNPLQGGEQQLILSQLLVMIAFMFSFVLTMTAAFAASPAIGPEIETGCSWRCWRGRFGVRTCCWAAGSALRWW